MSGERVGWPECAGRASQGRARRWRRASGSALIFSIAKDYSAARWPEALS
jgi:hypothetical protein